MQAKLSKPIFEIKNKYTVVVIGSGYGASITASRLARAGQSVCLLEKGREIRPGEFPDTLAEASPQMQINTAKNHIGDDTGLYDVTLGKGINVVKGCGLGGTSLINANVAIEPEPRVFERKAWPKAIGQNLESLKKGMERAKEMLRSTVYPEGTAGYPLLSKTKVHKESAAAINEPWKYLDINVNFENLEQGNHVGVPQKACNNCGDCASGCNVSAKNTLLMNYLPDAVNHGADIFCEVGVDHIKKIEGGWRVYYQILNAGRQKFEASLLFVDATYVFLGAGALGSTEILLKSAKNGALQLSDRLGERFTGNGDVLGFAYNTDKEINGIGFGKHEKKKPVGPCITSVIDARHKENLEEGMVIEEGSVPGAIRGILKPMLFFNARTIGQNTETGWDNWVDAKKRETESLFRGADHGALNNTQVYLIMAHDSASGRMSLSSEGRLSLDWEDVGKEKIFEMANKNLQKATESMGGTFVKNPVWTDQFDYDLVTVHPLGGCVMADDASHGVTNHMGQVYKGKTGTTLYEGLFVTDGAIVPCSLGTNPLLTISGLAERNVALFAQQNGWSFTYDFPKVALRVATNEVVGVQFTETMKGYIGLGESDFEKGKAKGQAQNSKFEFTLTIQVQDVDAFVDDPAHQAGMAGTVEASHLSTKSMTVSHGQFNLFVKDKNNKEQKYMQYQMQMHSEEGKTYFFKGYKDVYDDAGFDLWQDLTTLFIEVFEGEDEKGTSIGKGILYIDPLDFTKQITTMKSLNAKGLIGKTKGLVEFGKLFGTDVWDTYF